MKKMRTYHLDEVIFSGKDYRKLAWSNKGLSIAAKFIYMPTCMAALGVSNDNGLFLYKLNPKSIK